MDCVQIRKQIEQLRQEKGLFITVSNREWYSLFKDEIRNSIAIEGIFTNRHELLDVLERNKRTNKQKTAAILGYFESASAMYEYAFNQYREGEFVLRVSDIRQIHTILMRYEKEFGFFSGAAGEFRKANIEVAQASFKAIDVFFVRDAMSLFVKWINVQLSSKSCDPLFVAAVGHIWFETIHPFRDGNGRVGRILLSYILIGAGFINIAIKGITQYDCQKYYHSLEVCDECFEHIHRELEQGRKVSIQDVNRYIEKVDFSEFRTILERRMNEAVQILSRAEVSDSEVLVPLKKLAELYDYSPDYLRNLINRGRLRGIKKGKMWYVRVRDMQSYQQQRNQ